ncbi:MAG: ribosomal L7Ae/L30e/S12e/Gadd45 family protein [Candidatus Alkaliphilus sp. MAG34]|nr:50S ribosomal protein L7ae-like protein [Clostridiales bacterium]
MLGILSREQNKIIGIKQTTKALNHNKVKTLFISEDAEKHLVEHIEQIAKEKNIEIVYVDSMKDLGKACGINVGAAVAAVLK